MSHQCIYKANPSWYDIRCCIYCDEVDPTEPIAERLKEDKMKVTYRCPLCREVTHGKQGDICLDCEKWLRENKWLNEDDKVEGSMTDDICTHQPTTSLFQLGKCPLKPQTGLACANCEFYIPKRPALVKDMIK